MHAYRRGQPQARQLLSGEHVDLALVDVRAQVDRLTMKIEGISVLDACRVLCAFATELSSCMIFMRIFNEIKETGI